MSRLRPSLTHILKGRKAAHYAKEIVDAEVPEMYIRNEISVKMGRHLNEMGIIKFDSYKSELSGFRNREQKEVMALVYAMDKETICEMLEEAYQVGLMAASTGDFE